MLASRPGAPLAAAEAIAAAAEKFRNSACGIQLRLRRQLERAATDIVCLK